MVNSIDRPSCGTAKLQPGLRTYCLLFHVASMARAGRHCLERWHGMRPTISAEPHKPLLTAEYRIARIATVKRQLLTAVEVDAFIPERRRTHIAPSDIRWVAPDVFRTSAYWIDNKKLRVLGACIESGDAEWDVRGIPCDSMHIINMRKASKWEVKSYVEQA
nr:hypothetical protein [Burkholderia oklahomensis]